MKVRAGLRTILFASRRGTVWDPTLFTFKVKRIVHEPARALFLMRVEIAQESCESPFPIHCCFVGWETTILVFAQRASECSDIALANPKAGG